MADGGSTRLRIPMDIAEWRAGDTERSGSEFGWTHWHPYSIHRRYEVREALQCLAVDLCRRFKVPSPAQCPLYTSSSAPLPTGQLQSYLKHQQHQ